MITIKLAIAIIAFVLSGGQIVFQTFQHHHTINSRHGFIKFLVFILSSLSLVYLAKDIYADFDDKKNIAVAAAPVTSQAELDYWHEVYKNPSPESYCAYLEKYPQGQFVAIAKNGLPGSCLQVKQQAEDELKAKQVAEAAALKEKLETDTKALAARNAQLEKEAKDNTARIEALEAAKTEAELKAQSELNLEAQMEARLKARSESDSNVLPETELPAEDSKAKLNNTQIKAKTELDEQIF